jgi:hypothetical protein
MQPARHAITNTAMFAQHAAMVTIPIHNRRCFTQRFSPTGFILNASESRCSRPIVLRRIQVKTYPFRSILLFEVQRLMDYVTTVPRSGRSQPVKLKLEGHMFEAAEADEKQMGRWSRQAGTAVC